MKITERRINELKQQIKPIRNPINDIKFTMLINAIEQLNTANRKLDLNGLIVESYSQKYINPYFKVKTQSIKEILTILKDYEEQLKEDGEEDTNLLKSIMGIEDE